MTDSVPRTLHKLVFRLAHIGLGLATHLPFIGDKFTRGTGGTDSARYCYSVWLRHVVKAREAGVWNAPRRIAELGPGDSLGIGLTALLTGAEQYFAFDVVEHASNQQNLAIFDELVELVRSRADIPGEDEFPLVKPYLDDYGFPADVLSAEHIAACLSAERVARIRTALETLGQADDDGSTIRYVVPWMDTPDAHHELLREQSVDMICSQAVLEHVDDLAEAYLAMRAWLHKDGFISHQIDFKCHGTALDWDGHWAVPAFIWKIMRGARPYLINRQPCSEHVRLLGNNRFGIKIRNPIQTDSTLSRARLATEFRAMSDSDLNTSGLYVLAVPLQ